MSDSLAIRIALALPTYDAETAAQMAAVARERGCEYSWALIAARASNGCLRRFGEVLTACRDQYGGPSDTTAARTREQAGQIAERGAR